MQEQFIPTGNAYISLPRIRESDGAIEDITFLHMGCKGLLDIRGSGNTPLMKPVVYLDGKKTSFGSLSWNRLNHWIPEFRCEAGSMRIAGTILCPIDERGFIYRLEISNSSPEPHFVEAGLEGLWSSTWHCINEDKPMDGKQHVYRSGWNEGIVFDLRNGTPVFSFAPMLSLEGEMSYTKNEDGIAYDVLSSFRLHPGEMRSIDIFWGLGFEEVASATSAKELKRQGYACELNKTLNWLKKRSFSFKDPFVSDLFHVNLFFNFFFATGLTLDTEELVLVTSRSPRYYVSAAYWDRDSLLWSFPSVLLADKAYARDMLDYIFIKQIKNVGTHSRYIDGTVLEPGFELDELCAPVLALSRYVDATSDTEYLREAYVQKGIRRILSVLMEKKHPEIDLFETFLQPTDDMHVYRYITYDNVLVWRSLICITKLYESIWPSGELDSLISLSSRLYQAIFDHCVKTHDGLQVFAWSVDLEGNYDIYDEPPGSLQLLPFYGFISHEDPIFLNTVRLIRSPSYPYSFADSPIPETGCPHAPHPWVLSLANSLIFGRKEESLKILYQIKMDNFIACESVDENTGECTTGAAFATCAGFLAFALHHAFYEPSDENLSVCGLKKE